MWQARAVTTTGPQLSQALVAEAAKKSDLLWVDTGTPPARPVWHVWRDDAVWVVTGGLEQPDPGLVDGATVRLVLRSRDTWSRLLSVDATVSRVDTSAAGWDEAATALHAKRLNSPDGDAALDRWRRESTVWRLTPAPELVEAPGAMSDHAHRAVAPETPAASSTRRPFHLGRATRVRR
jgi:hypothetical protein